MWVETDVTDFKHPGGGEVLRQFSNGQDATDAFNRRRQNDGALCCRKSIASDHSKLFTDPYNKLIGVGPLRLPLRQIDEKFWTSIWPIHGVLSSLSYSKFRSNESTARR